VLFVIFFSVGYDSSPGTRMIIASGGKRTGICYFTVCYFYASSKTGEKPTEGDCNVSIKYAGITHDDDDAARLTAAQDIPYNM
jgi:hypothetical protein